MSMVAGCISIAIKAIELSHLLTPRIDENLRIRITAAGIYVKYSEMTTVARM